MQKPRLVGGVAPGHMTKTEKCLSPSELISHCLQKEKSLAFSWFWEEPISLFSESGFCKINAGTSPRLSLFLGKAKVVQVSNGYWTSAMGGSEKKEQRVQGKREHGGVQKTRDWVPPSQISNEILNMPSWWLYQAVRRIQEQERCMSLPVYLLTPLFPIFMAYPVASWILFCPIASSFCCQEDPIW